MNENKEQRIWADDGGNLVCEQHAGATLSAHIKAHPNAKSHRTTMGHYELLHASEIAELRAMLPDAPLCDGCPLPVSAS